MASRRISYYKVKKSRKRRPELHIYFADGSKKAVLDHLYEKELYYLASFLRDQKKVSYDSTTKKFITDKLHPAGEGELGYPRLPFPLDFWLVVRPGIMAAINWEAELDTFINYKNWTTEQKDQLAQRFQQLYDGEMLNLPEVPTLAVIPDDNDKPATHFLDSEAWDYYISYVAHSLVIEVKQTVPWSLLQFSEVELKNLLDSSSLFDRTNIGDFNLRHWFSKHGSITCGDPSRIFPFILEQDFIADTHEASIINVLDWCKENLVHYHGSFKTWNVNNQWQYKGYPPIERIISGTPDLSGTTPGISHRSSACHGTSGFLKGILRLMNIPCDPYHKGHSFPHFISIDKYLSHGDDPYNKLFKYSNVIPTHELFLDPATFDEWIVSTPNYHSNVGRRVRELAVQYLSHYLLKLHCDDIANGIDHASSEVFTALQLNYTLQELEDKDLWAHMDSQIQLLGGCITLEGLGEP